VKLSSPRTEALVAALGCTLTAAKQLAAQFNLRLGEFLHQVKFNLLQFAVFATIRLVPL
jgi:hypothetical protein